MNYRNLTWFTLKFPNESERYYAISEYLYLDYNAGGVLRRNTRIELLKFVLKYAQILSVEDNVNL